jgi:hypothetical protein
MALPIGQTANDPKASTDTMQGLPRGVYFAHVYEVDDTATTSSDAAKYPNVPMVKVTFKVAEGDYEGRQAWKNYVIAPELIGRFLGFLEACGLDAEVIRKPDYEFSPGQIEGALVRIVCSPDKNRDDGMHKVDRVMSVDSDVPTPGAPVLPS